NAKYPLAYLARARIRFWRGEVEAALMDINLVVDTLAPSNAYYLNDRPDVHRILGRLDAAEADYERSIALQPKQIDAYTGLALVDRARGATEKMRSRYGRMVAANPAEPRVYLRRAEYLRDTGDLSSAEADCALAERHGADPVVLALTRSSIAAARGEYAAA